MELVVKRFEELTVEELYHIAQARIEVFVVEQNCCYQDLDDKDHFSYHVFYTEDDQIQAYVRVVEPHPGCDTVSIGRVLTIKRREGLGKKIMREGIRVAQERLGATTILIKAQTYVKEFYEQLGFVETSDEFMDTGIPHIEMLLTL